MRHRCVGRLVVAAVAFLGLAILAAGPARAVIQGTTWFPIGPAPSCCFFPGGEAGRATSVAVNPANFFELYIGTANGGVWRSTDQAATWTALSDDQASLAIGSLALADCTDQGCDSLYAGTGENAIRRDTYYGRGLLVGRRQGLSGGGGMLWTLRTGTPYNFGRGSIYSVVLDPTTGGTSRRIFVALSSGVTASATESTVTAPQVVVSFNGPTAFKSVVDYGLYKSENDGVTWTKLTVAGINGDRPTDLEMDPTNHNVLYAGFLGKGLFKSVNNGIDWCPLSPGFPRGLCPVSSGLPDHAAVDFDHVEVAIDPANTSHLYASFGHCDDPLLEPCRPSVYESTDAGLNWALRYQGGPAIADSVDCPAAYSRYTHGLTVYPADAATVYLAGVRLCKSIDHGQTWSEADANSLGGSTHLDHHAVLFDAVGFRGYDVNDGGIALWQYPGTTW
ncbi:MAG TPA: hypothetical protein VFQ07_00795, partial [Candidatus Polarisedimenticolia bacterium]|nr:hypothetical protein [Candidatus Polarisedimenticolia bacterium]